MRSQTEIFKFEVELKSKVVKWSGLIEVSFWNCLNVKSKLKSRFQVWNQSFIWNLIFNFEIELQFQSLIFKFEIEVLNF